MSRLTHYIGRLPGVPTKYDRGKKRVSKTLNQLRGGADVLALIKGQHGWDQLPANIVDDGDEMWIDPVDDDERRFPAEGMPDTPPELYGCPIAIGYKHYGCLNEVPNVVVDSDELAFSDVLAALDEASEDGDDRERYDGIDPFAPVGDEVASDVAPDTGSEHLANRVRAQLQWAAGWPGRRYRGLRRWLGRRRHSYRLWRERKGWKWMQGDADCLILQQDGDAAIYCDRADYQPSSQQEAFTGYKTRADGDRYDARGAGAPPEPIGLGGGQLAIAYGPVTKLLSPVVCRIARNIHAKRLATVAPPVDDGAGDGNGGDVPDDGPDDGGAPDADGDADADAALVPENRTEADTPVAENGHAVADGGVAAEPPALPRHNDIILEERACIWPADIKLLGGEHITQEKLETAIKQIEAKQNPPGSQTLDKVLKIGGIILALILGATLGDPGALIQIADRLGMVGVFNHVV